jgi:tripartite-type tricarboxylate transporter receptor subunit TctC
MGMSRRVLLAVAGAATCTATSLAQVPDSYPSRPIRVIAPYSPGGGVDTTARLLAGTMGPLLGQPMVVDNRTGATGSLGAAELARSAPDGHTLMVDAMAATVNPALLHLSFDYATAFAPISLVVTIPLILVVQSSSPVRSVQELVALAKARPGQLTYGSSGIAASNHLAPVLLAQRAGFEAVHVPYRGGPMAMQDLLAGNLSFCFSTVASVMEFVRDGRVRALGVATAERLPGLPDLPTIAEQGYPGYELLEWNGLYAPAGTAPAIVDKLYRTVQRALTDAALRQRLDTIGAIPNGTDPESFSQFLNEQRAAMARLVREARIQAG